MPIELQPRAECHTAPAERSPAGSPPAVLLEDVHHSYPTARGASVAALAGLSLSAQRG